MNKINKIINSSIEKFINESNIDDFFNRINKNYLNVLYKEISQYNSSEELLRNGGISIETLDRLAFGFSEEDIHEISPNKLKIKWRDDYNNVMQEISDSKLSPQKWAKKIKLSEPIDVTYWEDSKHKKGFYIEDGHHRFVAAKLLNKPLKVNLEIKINPITEIAPDMGYDEFHRFVFNLYQDSIKH